MSLWLTALAKAVFEVDRSMWKSAHAPLASFSHSDPKPSHRLSSSDLGQRLCLVNRMKKSFRVKCCVQLGYPQRETSWLGFGSQSFPHIRRQKRDGFRKSPIGGWRLVRSSAIHVGTSCRIRRPSQQVRPVLHHRSANLWTRLGVMAKLSAL